MTSPAFFSPAPHAFTARTPTGPFRLGSWSTEPVDDLYRATIAYGGQIHRLEAAASGPIAALTDMLHQLGMGIAFREFHQSPAPDSGIVTRALCECGDRLQWCGGRGTSYSESALAALIDAANLFSESAPGAA